MDEPKEIKVTLNCIGAEELRKGGIYLLRAPYDLPMQHMIAIIAQVEILRQSIDVRFVIIPSNLKLASAEELNSMPGFVEVVQKVVEHSLMNLPVRA